MSRLGDVAAEDIDRASDFVYAYCTRLVKRLALLEWAEIRRRIEKALVDRLSPPPSRAGEEGVEALAQDVLDAIINLQGGWEPGTKDRDGVTPLGHIVRAIEAEKEACAKVCDRIEAKHRAHANALRDQGADAEACSYRDDADAVADCAAAIRAGKGGA